MKTVKKRIGILLAIIMVLTMIPLNSFGENTPSVSFSKQPGNITVQEGEIEAELSVDTESNANVASYAIYQWFSCDDANKSNPVAITEGGSDPIYKVPEELWTDGVNNKEYYYYCNVSYYNSNDNSFIAGADSNVAVVTVNKGTKYAIFDPNGGTFAEIVNNTEAQKVPIGADGKLDVSKIPSNPAMEGLKFVGWSLTGGNDEIIDPAAYEFNHTTRLYAVYAAVHTADFDANGGTFEYGGTEYFVRYTYGELYEDQLPDDPVREGYVFGGWYFKNDNGKEISLEDNWYPEFGGYFLPKDHYDFYAKWDAIGGSPGAGSEGTEDIESTVVADTEEPDANEPNTGDDSNMLLWMIIGVIAFAVGAATVFTRRE